MTVAYRLPRSNYNRLKFQKESRSWNRIGNRSRVWSNGCRPLRETAPRASKSHSSPSNRENCSTEKRVSAIKALTKMRIRLLRPGVKQRQRAQHGIS